MNEYTLFHALLTKEANYGAPAVRMDKPNPQAGPALNPSSNIPSPGAPPAQKPQQQNQVKVQAPPLKTLNPKLAAEKRKLSPGEIAILSATGGATGTALAQILGGNALNRASKLPPKYRALAALGVGAAGAGTGGLGVYLKRKADRMNRVGK